MPSLKSTQKALEKFEYFLFEMDDVLTMFLEEVSTQLHNCHLDFSLDSLCCTERFLLQICKEDPDLEMHINRVARYIGEVFRKTVGGKWELCLKDPKYLYYGLPVISGFSDLPIEFCPIEVTRNFVRSRRLGLIRNAIESNIEFKRG